ncbi:hypothetical protein N8I77_012460 [Diaporthe amygdali]|uniref:RRM domain-containing protein n=1 Tax=Phomopsis amygdali TaxID=1214568 RepID=A0AAD9VZM8_PHOAM|nr:hypothetical protein N8I77_012460 [Diaporthe amygdali]
MYIYAMTLKDESWHWVVVLPKPLIPFLLTDKKYSDVTRFARHPKTGWFGLTDNGQVINMPQTMKPPLYNPLYQEFGYHPDSSPYIVQQHCPRDHACKHQGNPPAQNKDQSSCEVLSNWPPLNGRRPWVVHPHCANPQLPSKSTFFYNHSCRVHNGQYYGKRRSNQYTDWHNTTIFVGGLRKKMTDDELRFWFEGFGELLYVNKKVEEEAGEKEENVVQEGQDEEGGQEGDEGYTCGFVQFADRKVAEMAMAQMQGFPINGCRLRLSWGRRYIFTDKKSQEVYKLAVKQAYKGYLAFSERIRRGEPRLPDDPEFWQKPDAKLMEYDDPDVNEGD